MTLSHRHVTQIACGLTFTLISGCAAPDDGTPATQQSWNPDHHDVQRPPPPDIELTALGLVDWGTSTEWLVTGLEPFSNVSLLGSAALGEGLCPGMLDGWCVDLAPGRMRLIDSGSANGMGEALLTLDLPAGPVAGLHDLAVQAVQQGGASAVSNVVLAGIGPTPPHYDGIPVISSSDLFCSGSGWHLETVVAGWASEAVVNIWETGAPIGYGWNEEHGVTPFDYDAGGRWDLWHSVLEDGTDVGSFEPGVNTVFTCGYHDDYTSITVSARIYDTTTGALAGCWIWGDDPDMVLGGFYEYNPTSNPHELNDCRVLPYP